MKKECLLNYIEEWRVDNAADRVKFFQYAAARCFITDTNRFCYITELIIYYNHTLTLVKVRLFFAQDMHAKLLISAKLRKFESQNFFEKVVVDTMLRINKGYFSTIMDL